MAGGSVARLPPGSILTKGALYRYRREGAGADDAIAL
jgi:hypothetical protein